MGGETQGEGKRRKREHPSPPASPCRPDESFFPLVIASCANIRETYAQQILEQLLLLAQLAFARGRGGGADTRPPDQILHPGLLALLPLLLNQTRKDDFAVLAAEMVGAVALYSLDANERIASDGETVKAVVAALGNPSKKVAMAACSAVLDLTAGPLGRERLRESFAVEKLWWEGFAHVALCCWDQKQKEKYSVVDSGCGIPNFMIINLLHIAIMLIGDEISAFRKACLVAASLQSDNGSPTCAEHLQNLALLQKSIFADIINSIDVQSNFMDAFRKLEEAVHENNDSFLLRLRWIQHLSQDGNEIMFDFNNMLEAFEQFLLLARGCMEAVETTFVQVKHQFCTSIIFEDVRKSFETLQNGYRKTRRQYMNGMLTLHSAS